MPAQSTSGQQPSSSLHGTPPQPGPPPGRALPPAVLDYPALPRQHAADRVRFERVTLSYGAKVALRDISISVPPNKIFGIIGPANSGKTTLLKCISRMID